MLNSILDQNKISAIDKIYIPLNYNLVAAFGENQEIPESDRSLDGLGYLKKKTVKNKFSYPNQMVRIISKLNKMKPKIYTEKNLYGVP